MLRRHAELISMLRRGRLLILLLAIAASLLTAPVALASHPHHHHHGTRPHARKHAEHYRRSARHHRKPKRSWRACGYVSLHGEHAQIRAHHVACRQARQLIRRFSRKDASMKIAPGWECQLGGTDQPVLEFCASPTLAHYHRWAEEYSKTAFLPRSKRVSPPPSTNGGVAWTPPPHWCSLKQPCSDAEVVAHRCEPLQADCAASLCARSRNQRLWGIKMLEEGSRMGSLSDPQEAAIGDTLTYLGADIQVQAAQNLAIYCSGRDYEAAEAEGSEQADRLTLTIEVPFTKSAELATVLSTVIEGAEVEDPGFVANAHTSGSVDGWEYGASAGAGGLSFSISLTPPMQAS